MRPMHPLDHPVWASLTGPQEALSIGGRLARRYRPEVHQFAATRDASPAALAALADLVGPGEQVFIAQATAVVVPPGLRAVKQARGVQMVAVRPIAAPEAGPPVRALGDADVPDMLALTRLTEPGPFMPRTHTMGRFLGVHEQGRLLAMAGERFHLPGFTEVSGVCVHPEARGRGLARHLSALVAAAIQARGETPFLHAWQTNEAAITLYRSLGFDWRADLNIAVLARDD